MTMSFYAPHHGNAESDAVAEFRELVEALHAAGIEVWLDVVYNHTAEGDDQGPTYSFRGLDNDSYYIVEPDGSYANYSGCDVTWFGTSGGPDLAPWSHSVAWHLSGAAFGEGDLYVMVNAHNEELIFEVQVPGPWRNIVDTAKPSGQDVNDSPTAPLVGTGPVHAGPRSIVVLGTHGADHARVPTLWSTSPETAEPAVALAKQDH